MMNIINGHNNLQPVKVVAHLGDGKIMAENGKQYQEYITPTGAAKYILCEPEEKGVIDQLGVVPKSVPIEIRRAMVDQ